MFASTKNRWLCSRHAAANRRPRRRWRLIERLEPRILLATAEGTPFALGEVLDASRLAGSLSAEIDWGDGVTTAADASPSGGGSLVGRVDYSFDTNNFFDTQVKKDLLQLAVDTILSQLGDDLAEIMPSGQNTWMAEFADPGTGDSQTITDLQVAADEIVIFAGGRDLGGSLGIGGTGGFSVSCVDPLFCDTVSTRGESGVTEANSLDFGPWGGSISFDASADFHFSDSTDDLGSQQADFLSAAMHEVAHVLGFGTSRSWTTFVSGSVFSGPAAQAAYGDQGVPLAGTSNGGHWANGTQSDGQEAAMDPSLTTGTRKLFTTLDFAALDDVGWDLLLPTATVAGSHTYGDDGVYDIIVTLAGSGGGVTTRQLQETVTNVPPALVAADDQAVGLGEPFTIADVGVFTDPGFGASETFTYTIDWGDGSTLGSGSASIDSSGVAGAATEGSYDGTHTYVIGGNYSVTVTVTDDDGGTDSGSFQLSVSAALSVEIAAEQIPENGGIGVTTLTITRLSNDLSQSLTVLLSTDESELDIPASVELPAGEATVVVDVDAVDDDVLDGAQGVTITATATGFLDGTDDLIVTDHETLSLTIDTPTVLERAGSAATFATVRRNNTNIDAALEVVISIDDGTEASAAESIIIPAGEASATFSIDAIEDEIADGPQLVTFTVMAGGYISDSDTLRVSDVASWHNAAQPRDVDGDGNVSPIDVLLIVNDLNSRGARPLSVPELAAVPPYLDVNDDGFVSAVDALIIVNALNNGAAN
ncbi:MAG: dockerin type I domain-containing protein [Planctomycetota bacterium]|nr:dockerin type I domain-containing protein [Planctomycetota bacterium]